MDKLKRVVIKEEYVALTGDYRAAIILNQFIYWSERIKDFDKFIEEENERIERFDPDSEKFDKNSGWIYKTADDLIEECMLVTTTKDNKNNTSKKGSISRTTILNYIDLLVENKWIEKRNNPKYKWDKTLQYRVNLIQIAIDLFKIGYILQEYSLSKEFYDHIQKLIIESTILDTRSSEIENQNPVIENQDLIIENGGSITGEQYQRLLPEITPYITTDRKEKESSTASIPLDDFYKSIKQDSNITDISFKTWIEPLNISQADNKIIIAAPNEVTKNIIQGKFLNIIEKHLKIYFNFDNIELITL